MTKHSVFECDGCGERFGAANQLRNYRIVVGGNHLWDDVERFTLHACTECEENARLRTRKEIYHTIGVIGWCVDSPTGEIQAYITENGELSRRDEMGEYAKTVAEFIEQELL